MLFLHLVASRHPVSSSVSTKTITIRMNEECFECFAVTSLCPEVLLWLCEVSFPFLFSFCMKWPRRHDPLTLLSLNLRGPLPHNQKGIHTPSRSIGVGPSRLPVNFWLFWLANTQSTLRKPLSSAGSAPDSLCYTFCTINVNTAKIGFLYNNP